jgi:hypothetical protein
VIEKLTIWCLLIVIDRVWFEGSENLGEKGGNYENKQFA